DRRFLTVAIRKIAQSLSRFLIVAHKKCARALMFSGALRVPFPVFISGMHWPNSMRANPD
ncbi:MAG TPA: hypothetical protein VJ727_10270, partial [Rhodanobacteraceae bacterium]|nr:hypothetical protein [Rhodanobacteraceae bacterium]